MRITHTLIAVCICFSVLSAQWREEAVRSVATAASRPGFGPSDAAPRICSPRPVRATSVRHEPSARSREAFALDGEEFLIDTSGALVPAPGGQGSPVTAFDGENFLVVWTDGDLRGTRVTPAGDVLDPNGFAISTAPNDQLCPALAFDGENFLVVWQDGRSGFHVYGARVTPAGSVLDPAGIAISPATRTQVHPAVAFDGENFLVAWEDRGGGPYDHDIYGARVTPAGVILDPAGIAISTAWNNQESPALASDGENFLVVWTDGRDDSFDIYGARVTPAGVLLDTTGIAFSTATDRQESPALAFDGENFLVVWDDYRNDLQSDIYGARVTPGGVVLDPHGIIISIDVHYQWSPAIDFDGENFLVVWEDASGGWGYDIYAARVTPAGAVLDPTGVAVSTAADDQTASALALDGENLLVVWQDERGGGGLSECDIYGARVTPAGVVLDTAAIAISTVTSDQLYPALAFDGENFLVIWEDERSGINECDIYGARVTPTGVVLDTAAIVISAATGRQSRPAPAFDGENFLVVWEDERAGDYQFDIYGARVTPEGQVLDPGGIIISDAEGFQGSPVIAFDGESFLVAWADGRSIPYYDIYGARVTPAGVVLDAAGIHISTATADGWYPAVAFDSSNFLVVWEDMSSGSDIYGARVTPAGVLLDTAGIAISTAADEQRYPALAFDGENSLVVWEHYRSGFLDLYGARVTPGGVVLDPAGIPISTASSWQGSAAVAFDGTNHLVAWADGRGSGGSFDIYGARVAPTGSVFDSGPVVTQAGNQGVPALDRGAAGQMLLVYSGWSGSVGGKTYDSYHIWGKVDPNPAIAEMTNPDARKATPRATVVRGVLFLPEAVSGERLAGTCLLDVSGRKVMDLGPGANDVRALAPGVYFIREAQAQAQAQTIHRVIVAR